MKPVRLDFIDGIRAAAALFVVLGHAYFQPQNGFYDNRIMTHLGLTYGRLAVVVFIVVSGFCLGLPTARRGDMIGSLKEFAKRRMRRILPPFYACLALSILFIVLFANAKTGTVWDNSLPLTKTRILTHAALLHDLPLSWQVNIASLFGIHDFPAGELHGDINYPLWSIAVEFQLYLLFPLIVLSFRKWGGAAISAIAVALGLVFHEATMHFFASMTPWFLGAFVMGAAAAGRAVNGDTADKQMMPLEVIRKISLNMFLLLALALIGYGKGFHDRYEPYVDTWMAAATALLLVTLYADATAHERYVTRFFSSKLLVKIGIFSYSLYLVHAPMLHLMDRIWVASLNPSPIARFLLLVVSIPLIVGVAYLFHLVFERPFLSMRKAIQNKSIHGNTSLETQK
ncbi:MAG: acyltransferase [Chthonomonadales bacterium]